MIKYATFIMMAFLLGCAQIVPNSVSPSLEQDTSGQSLTLPENPHNLWGAYHFIFSDDHNACDIVPLRAMDFHLNALKFLEDAPCTNCVTISNLTQLGGGVIEFDVTIHHPYEFQLEYSAFDVKGIIMFDGSLKFRIYHLGGLFPGLTPWCYMSWAKRGDWELQNADGYSLYFSPAYNPDSQWPISHYIPGNFSSGTPTSMINGYKEFYTDEERHLFRPGNAVTRTYRIQTQPGPMVVGYAIDACWWQPMVTPVTDPLTDFSPAANAHEPYRFDVVVNDGDPVTEPDKLCDKPTTDAAIRIYIDQWNGMTVTKTNSFAFYEIPGVLKEMNGVHDYFIGSNDELFNECIEPGGDNCFCGIELCFQYTGYPYGWYRLVTLTYWGSGGDYGDHAIDATDFYYDPG